MKWLKNIVVISSILFLFVQATFAEDPPSAQDAAKNQYERFRSLSGSPENLKQNFLDPTLGGSPLYTIDRSQSGNVVVGCPSSNAFLTIMITPRPTGDFDATIFQNNVGRFSISGVSGVCSNGFIICDPGTWINCMPYKFFGSGGNLTIGRVGIVELSGCFCINNSCGNGLVWHNLPYVLKIFGGAAAGALQKGDPRFAVSQVKIDGNTIQFFGQQEGGCSISEITNKGGALYPERYYGSPAMIQSGVESEVLAQRASSDSYYSLLSGLSQSQGNLRSCVIERNVYTNRLDLYDIIAPVSGNGGTVRPCGDKCIQVVLGWEGDNYWCGCCNIHELYYDLMVKRPDLIESATLVYAVWDDWIQFWFNNYLIWNGPYGNWTSPTGLPPGPCELSTSWRRELNVDATSFFSGVPANSIVRTKTRVAVCGCGEGFGLVNIKAKNFCEKQENISNTCQQYIEDPTCVLVDEKVDGVYTIRNQVKTGLIPIQRCENVCGDYVCPDFWRKERTYRCQSPDWDLSDAKRRLATVVPTSEYDGSKITFTDVRKENNLWNTYPNQIFYVQQGQQPEDCEKACKVKVVIDNTQVGIGTPVSQFNLTSGNYGVRYYRTCYNDQCPLKDGEIMEAPCQCVQNFPGAVTAMQAIRMAGQDIICSSGNIKALPGASR